MSDKPLRHAVGESEDCAVPVKVPNNGPPGPAEELEGRRSIKENAGEPRSPTA